MKIYTRTGDRGETSLLGGTRISKDDPRIESYGTVDELNSFIGLARAHWTGGPIDLELHQIQIDLFEIGAQLASVERTDRFAGVSSERIEALERSIDAMDRNLPPLTAFILPGGSIAAAHLHVGRTVCRRAERLVIRLAKQIPMETTVIYLNRLSDYLFVAARFANQSAGIEDLPWIRG